MMINFSRRQNQNSFVKLYNVYGDQSNNYNEIAYLTMLQFLIILATNKEINVPENNCS